MILDVFNILFKFNSQESKKQIADIDQQLTELEKKGKKRDENENKRFAELKKQRKDTIDQIVQQRNEIDKLDNKFQDMISNAVGAVTAFATFQGLKTSLIDANKLNVSLSNLALNYHLNANEIKAYGAALEQAGGNAQDLYNFVNQKYGEFRANRQTPPPLKDILNTLNSEAQNPGLYDQAIKAQGAEGLSPLIRQNPDRFRALLEQGQATATLNKQQEDAARKNKEAYAQLDQQIDSVATEMNTALRPAIVGLGNALRSITETFRGHPALGGVEYGLLGIGGTVASIKSVGWVSKLFGLFRGGSAATAGAEAVGGTAAATGAGTLALGSLLVGAVSAALVYGSSALGNVIGTKIKEGRSGGQGGSPPQFSSNQKRIYDFWISQGYSPGAAAGWTANAQAESSFNPLATNGTHVGIYQWSADRRKRILKGTGIDVGSASIDDQLRAAAWEAQHSYGLGPGAFNGNPANAAGLISNRFEIPSTTQAGLAAEAARRGAIAANYNLPGGGGGAGSQKIFNVKIDEITVNTQATDAAGVAGAVSGELKNQIRVAMSNFDDGVNY